MLQLLRQNQLFAKRSKCDFAQSKIEYLGHVISGQGVGTDPTKVSAMMQCPVPKSQLRGFLGLTGYYRKFVQNYNIISKPLASLLKRGAFEWNSEATRAFLELKTAMTSAPLLALPNFNKTFIVEVDACGTGVGAILMQDGHPLAYISEPLSMKHQGLSTYEKKLIALLMAVDK